jgi:hypothetical protein
VPDRQDGTPAISLIPGDHEAALLPRLLAWSDDQIVAFALQTK